MGKRIIALLITCAAVLIVIQGFPRVRIKDRYGEIVPLLKRNHDEDGDGVDDQEDILNSAVSYLSQKPKYRSGYYGGGWPDDGYGTCTDVVGYALLGAGYNLQILVDQDIVSCPEAYDVYIRDPNIDFRRVKNLRVFFERNAERLTLDLSDQDAWQAGDIVVFENHIGIISDRRGRNGIPYVLHHNSPLQLFYEEDILGKRKDLCGHYRFPKWNKEE